MAIINVDEEEGLKCLYYTETNEIEVVKGEEPKAYIYFENIEQLADLIKTSPRLTEDLVNLLLEA